MNLLNFKEGLLAFLFFNCVTFYSFAQTYERPFVLVQTNVYIIIDRIEIEEKRTKVDLLICNYMQENLKFSFPKGNRSKEFYIEDYSNNTKYRYLGKSSNTSSYQLKFEKCKTVTLFFEKIPSNLRRFNLIYGEKDDFWDFQDVDLDRPYRNIGEQVLSYMGTFRVSYVKRTDFFFKETYIIEYKGRLTEYLSEEGKFVVWIDEAKLVDPSWVSVNYTKYRSKYSKLAENQIGSIMSQNACTVSIDIW